MISRLLIGLSLLLGSIGLFFHNLDGVEKKQAPSLQISPTTHTTKLIPVRFTTNQRLWHPGKAEIVTLNFNQEPDLLPTAIDVIIQFDKDVLSAETIETNLWSDSNVLKKEVDNNNGTIRLAAGQGFSAQTVQQSAIVTIVFVPKKLGRAIISLSPQTKIANGKEKNADSLEAETLNIEISK